jgi:hypothetical protein
MISSGCASLPTAGAERYGQKHITLLHPEYKSLTVFYYTQNIHGCQADGIVSVVKTNKFGILYILSIHNFTATWSYFSRIELFNPVL